MAQYLVLCHDHRSSYEQEISPEEIEAVIKEYTDWRDKLLANSHLVGGEKLTDDGGRHLTPNGNSVDVTDGPYAELKEILGGYFVIQAASYDQAQEICSDCPHLKFGGRIEIREIEQHS